jgi:hypothetical protein
MISFPAPFSLASLLPFSADDDNHASREKQQHHEAGENCFVLPFHDSTMFFKISLS